MNVGEPLGHHPAVKVWNCGEETETGITRRWRSDEAVKGNTRVGERTAEEGSKPGEEHGFRGACRRPLRAGSGEGAR
jgi:hypothetical protein